MSTDKIMEFEIPKSVDGSKGQKLFEIVKPFKAHIDHVRGRVSCTIPESKCQEIVAELHSYGLRLADNEEAGNEI